MKTFLYRGVNQRQASVKGELEAENEIIARVALQKQGILVQSIKAKSNFNFNTGKRITAGDIARIARQLATMTSAGVPLVQSVGIMIDGDKNIRMKKMLTEIKNSLESGSSLSESLQKFPKHFDVLFCGLVEAGEQSGTLEEMLHRIAMYKEKTESLKKKIKKAMYYPASVLVVAFIVTAILLIFVVPQFESMFNDFGAQLPAFTQMVLSMSEWLRDKWWLALIIVIAFVTVFRIALYRSIKFKRFMDRFVLKVPVLGKILKLAAVARYSRTLSTTFAAGMPLIEALETVAVATGNSVYSDAVLAIREDVTTGQTLNQAMRNTQVFSNLVVQMVLIGEESGALESMLAKVADNFEEDVDIAVDSLSSLLEPMIMVVLGLLVGGLVVAMYLPVFELGSVM